MAGARLGHWLFVLVCAVMLLKAAGLPVGITYVHGAVAKGAGEKLLCKYADKSNFLFFEFHFQNKYSI